MLDHQQYDITISERIYQWSAQQFLTDLHLKSDEGTAIACHQVILSAISAKLKQLLETEKNISELEMFASTDTVKEIVKFIYTGCCNLTMENVDTIYQVGNTFEINKLIDYCHAFMRDTITVENCIDIHEFATNGRFLELQQFASTTISENLASVVNSNQLQKLPLGTLKNVLLSGVNGLDREESKLQIILKWLAVSSCDDIAQSELLSFIDFARITQCSSDMQYTNVQTIEAFMRNYKTFIEQPTVTEDCKLSHILQWLNANEWPWNYLLIMIDFQLISEQCLLDIRQCRDDRLRLVSHICGEKELQPGNIHVETEDVKLLSFVLWMNSWDVQRMIDYLLLIDFKQVTQQCLHETSKNLGNDVIIKFLCQQLELRNSDESSLCMLSEDKYICRYDDMQSSWRKVCKIPGWTTGHTPSSTYKSCVIFAGAKDSLDGLNVEMCDMRSEKCLRLPPLPIPLHSPGNLVTRRGWHLHDLLLP